MATLTSTEYRERISAAETAVAEMTDPQLRQVAFAKILEQLLAQDTDVQPQGLSSVAQVSHRHRVPHLREGIKGGPVGLIEALIKEQFFNRGKSLREVQIELQNRGHRIPRTSLSGPLQSLCRRRLLRRSKENSSSGKTVYVYSNW